MSMTCVNEQCAFLTTEYDHKTYIAARTRLIGRAYMSRTSYFTLSNLIFNARPFRDIEKGSSGASHIHANVVYALFGVLCSTS